MFRHTHTHTLAPWNPNPPHFQFSTTKMTNRGGKNHRAGNVVSDDGDASSSNINSRLPASLLLQIFVRLPIFAVINCKFVCNTWYKLLSEPSFTDFYRSNSIFTQLLLPKHPFAARACCQLCYLVEIAENGDSYQSPVILKLPDWVQRKFSQLAFSSCNGLLTLSLNQGMVEVIYLANLLTEEFVELPRHVKDSEDMTIPLYELGYCPYVDRFRVIRMVLHGWNDFKIKECEILTVGLDHRWSRVRGRFLPRLEFGSHCVCANGAFHWILPDDDDDDNESYHISTFDLALEKVGRISHPTELVLDSRKFNLALLNNQLILVDFSLPFQIGIWTMKDYGSMCWAKDVILRSWIPPSFHVSRLFPLEKLQNGDILFTDSGSLIAFSVKAKKCTEIDVFGFPRYRSHINRYTPNFKSFEEIMRNQEWRIMYEIQPEY